MIAAVSAASCTRNDVAVSRDGINSVSWWCSNRASSFGVSMNELPVFRELQTQTDTNIDFKHPPSNQYALRFNLMLASGRLTDIISHDFINDYPGGAAGAVQDGIILPLDDELMKHAPNLSAYLSEHPDIADSLKLSNGDYFCIPSLNPASEAATYIGPFIRKDLLDKHGLKPPMTIPDWEAVLAVFSEDPEIDIPLTFYGGNFRDTRFLAGGFGTDWGFYLKNGRITYGPSEPEFIDFIKLFHRWYRKGWIDPGVLMNSRKAYSKTVANSSAGIYIDYVSSMMNYSLMLEARGEAPELIPLANPSLNESSPVPAGHQSGVFIPFAAAYITTKAEDPAAVIRMLDYAWSDDGHRLFNYGIEGESYSRTDGKAVFNDLLFDSPNDRGGVKYYIVSGPYLKDKDSFLQNLRLDNQKEAVRLWRGEDASYEKLPLLVPDREDGIRVEEIGSALDAYVFETATDIVSGKIDYSALNDFGADLDRIGLEEVLVIYNRLYQQR